MKIVEIILVNFKASNLLIDFFKNTLLGNLDLLLKQNIITVAINNNKYFCNKHCHGGSTVQLGDKEWQ